MIFTAERLEVYYASGLLCLLGYGFQLWRDRHRSALPLGRYALLGTAALILARIPVILCNYELNADESVLLAQGLTLQQGSSVFWREIDGSTSGPFNSYFPYLLSSLTGLQGYLLGRLAALLCTGASWLLLLLMLRRWLIDQRIAHLLALLPLGFWTVTLAPMLVSYNSELLPVLGLQGIATAGIYFYRTGQRSYAVLTGIGMVLLPLTKLQIIPLEIGLMAVLLRLAQRRGLLRPWLTGLFAGGTATLLVLAGAVVWADVFEPMYFYYWLRNLTYTVAPPLVRSLQKWLRHDVWHYSGELPLVLALAAAWTTAFWLRRLPNWLDTLALGLLVLSGTYAVFRTGHNSDHYLLLIVHPMLWGVGYLYELDPVRLPDSWGMGLSFVWLGCGIWMSTATDRLARYSSAILEGNPNFRVEKQVGTLLHQLARPGARLVVWGWGGPLHVRSQLAQGTHENHVDFLLFFSPVHQAESRRRYLQDLRTNQPDLFVDYQRSLAGDERQVNFQLSFPELAQYLRRHYVRVATVENVLVYRRKLSGIRTVGLAHF